MVDLTLCCSDRVSTCRYIVDTLASSAEYHACAVCVGLVGDICRCVGSPIKEHAYMYMQGLGAAIQESKLDRSVKPQILSCVGDVAMALGPDFLP
jgi:importin subunit beta-1